MTLAVCTTCRAGLPVPEDGLDEKSLGEWIARATSYVGPLPAKVKKPRTPRKRAKTG